MAAITFSRATATYNGNQMGISASITVPNITASGSTFTIPTISGTITSWTYNSSTYIQSEYQNSAEFSCQLKIDGSNARYLTFSRGYLDIGSSSGWASKSWTATSSGTTLNTATYFNSSNPTVKSLPITLQRTSWYIVSDWGMHESTTAANGSGTAYLTLNVPPTVTVSSISYDKPYVYSGLTTASVTVSDATAYYGGTVSDVTFKIGNQTASISGNGTLSIALDTAGTFTPTVTVTDSRGQTHTESLPQITVNTYVPPTVSFTAERTTSVGKPDDEGTYATAEATFVFADVIASADVPSVILTDENGTQTAPVTTWYSSRASDGTLSGSVTWANLSSGDTVYGLVPGLNTNYSYQLSIRPRDSQGTGTAISQTVAAAFYTLDFLAGGHGIAFGMPASNTGFYCDMEAHFLNGVEADSISATSLSADSVSTDSLVIDSSPIFDFITEAGTSGRWYYEKYSSGLLKAWYDSGGTTVTLTTSSGNGWYRNPNAYTISIPSAIGCNSIRYVNIVTSTSLAHMITSVVSITTTTLSYYVSHLGTISDYTARVMAEIVGTWT